MALWSALAAKSQPMAPQIAAAVDSRKVRRRMGFQAKR